MELPMGPPNVRGVCRDGVSPTCGRRHWGHGWSSSWGHDTCEGLADAFSARDFVCAVAPTRGPSLGPRTLPSLRSHGHFASKQVALLLKDHEKSNTLLGSKA